MRIALASLFVALCVLAPSRGDAQPDTPEVRRSSVGLGEPPETTIRLARFLTFGAEIEFDYEFRHNLDLDGGRDDDASLLIPQLSLAFSLDPAESFQAFLNAEISREFALAEGADRPPEDRDVALELREAFLWLKGLLGGLLSVQAGRQRFEDDREWLYDEELDAIRLWYARGSLAAGLSVSRNGLVRKDLFSDEGRERINNYVLHTRYQLQEDLELEGYVIVRDDRSSERQDPVFFGLRSHGEIVADLDHWFELSHVRGQDASKEIRGWGVDVGATYEFDVRLEPSLTVGYAFGTGDPDPDDGVDESFRQTGLQENESDFNGVTSFKYYGELFNPELSNLSIFTVGVGIRPTRRSSLDLVYHYYVQHERSDAIRSSEVDADPSGLSKRLGSALDLVAGFEGIRNRVDIKMVMGYFLPGAAFAREADGGFIATAEIQFRF